MHRKKLIAGNHKMHTSLQEGLQLAKNIHQEAKTYAEQVDIVLFPPFTHTFAVSGVLKNTAFYTGGQNCASEAQGAFTGEVSAAMLKSAGATYVLVGHSERRALFAESNEMLSKKIEQAIQAQLHIIFCYGETLSQREDGTYLSILQEQLAPLKLLSPLHWEYITLAYEPVWAIGTGKTASAAQAQEIHLFSRNWIAETISAEIAAKTRILYGGSVKPENAGELLSQPDIDGALVGGASLDAESFSAIIKAAL